MSPILPAHGIPRNAAPVPQRAGTLALAAIVGRDSLDRQVALLRPLHEALGGDIVLVDDGTLGGADRVKLARACGDPAFVQARSGSAEWTLLRAAIEGRRNAYWLVLGDSPSLEFVLPDLSRAIAGNRSFAILDEEAPANLEPHLATLTEDGWPYVPASPDIVVGLAAGGNGVQVVTILHARLETTGVPAPDIARALPGFLLARERNPVLLDKPGSVHSPGRNSLI